MPDSRVGSLESCLRWYRVGEAEPPDPGQYCATRDVFEGRLSRMLTACERAALPGDDAALLVAIAGEVGNNAFDHNLGHWLDAPGCYFGYTLERSAHFWIADRGRGVLHSLQAVLPSLDDHQLALETAFEKTVSGRHPERRGNGLKFVRRVVNQRPNRGLVAVSGTGCVWFGGLGEALRGSHRWPTAWNRGTLVVAHWRFT